MIPEFERLVKRHPREACFSFIEKDGHLQTYSYAETRFRALAFAAVLERHRVSRGDFVVVDADNCPAMIAALLGSAYAGATLVVLNHRLTPEEKRERIADLRMVQHLGSLKVYTEADIEHMIEDVAFDERTERMVHFGEHSAALFDDGKRALVLFTSGTTGRPKAVSLEWRHLRGASEASNRALATAGRGLWQAALPLYHIGGVQIVVRSVLNGSPFFLYRRFDAKRVLQDAERYGATHISVVDKMLQDLIAADTSSRLKLYQGILLGGAATNPVTLVHAVARQARVFASYGMTETSAQIASTLVEADFDGALTMLPGYQVQIVAPDERGVGQLAVKGPGVFSAYLNARAAFTADGFFLTGDTASLVEGRIKVEERTGDMFVSGGENVYPSEICDKILRVSGASDAYVFGVEDATWGRRPIAFIERDARLAPSSEKLTADIRDHLSRNLSRLYRPREIFTLDRFPRTGIGKVDKERLQTLYDQRLEIQSITLYRVDLPLAKPFRTAKTIMRTRESLLIKVEDWQGRTGIGECVAFATDWYLPETLDHDERVIEELLAPIVLNQRFLHPRDASAAFARCEDADAFPMARGALEPALWDLYGKITGKSLATLLREEALRGGSALDTRSTNTAVPAGMVVGIMPLEQTRATVAAAVERGYTRVKLKIKPGDDLQRVQMVREAFPDLTLMLDANQSYTEDDLPLLRALDALNIRCIEEPLAPSPSARSRTSLYERLSRLQYALATPICLDESILGPEDALQALTYPNLRCFAVKIGKWGGVKSALDFYLKAQEVGAEVWMGGMYEAGVSKYLHAAFETLPGVDLPGDLSATSRYFTREIVQPPFEVSQGSIRLNQEGYRTGLGCELDPETLGMTLLHQRHLSNS